MSKPRDRASDAQQPPSVGFWRRGTFLLSVLAGAALLSSLFINHYFAGLYEESSATNARSGEVQARLAGLLALVGDLAAPGNDALESGNAADAALRLDAAADSWRSALQSIRDDAPRLLESDDFARLEPALGTAESAFRRMYADARQMLSYVRTGQSDNAMSQMAALTRQSQTLTVAIARAQSLARTMQTAERRDQALLAQQLRLAVFTVASFAALVSLLLLLHGRRVSRAWSAARAAHDHVAAESRLHAERFELAARGTHDGIWDWSRSSQQMFFSDRLHELLGLPPGSLRDREQFTALIHDDDRAHALAALDAHLAERDALSVEFRVRHADGTYRWFLFRGQALWDETGVPQRMSGSLTDITARKLDELRIAQSAATLSAERARLAAFVEHAPAAIAMFDSQLRFVCASRRWVEAFLGRGGNIAGQALFEAMPHPPQGWRTSFARVLAGDVVNVDDELWQPDESAPPRHLRWEARPWQDVSSGQPGVMLSVLDITADRAREAELALMRDAAESANRAKSEFLATMSHEIRTPMNGVLGFTQLLLDTPLDTEQREFVTTIDSSGQALLALLNDILDYSKIEAGKLSVESLDFELEPILEEVTGLLGPQIFAKGLDLLVDYEAEAPRRLCGDPARTRQVLLNLLGNSLKFTEQGHILLEVGSDPDGLLRVSVTDTGIGMTEQVQSRLFGKFVQADSTTTRRFGGTGLGLAICRQLVEMMGGEIGVRSVMGAGSTFWFTLPTAAQPAATFDAPAAASQLGELRGLRMLIVDDTEPNRRIIAAHAKRWGMPFETAVDGDEALQRLAAAHRRGQPFDVAVIDYLMPEMDGEQLCIQLRSDTRFADLAMIMLTSSAQRGEAQRMLQAGYDAYLTKPLLRASRLLDAIADSRVKRLAGVADTLLAAPVPAIASGTTNVAPSAQAGKALEGAADGSPDEAVLVVEDNSVNRMLAIRVLRKLGYRAEIACDGAEAVAIVQRQRFALILMDCHMPNMDGFEATDAIRKLEQGGGRRTPIVALTAGAMHEERERCLKAGMDAFLSKPFVPTELVAMLERWSVPRAELSRAAG